MALSSLRKVGAFVGLSILPSIVAALPASQSSGSTCSGWTYVGCYNDASTTTPTLRFPVTPSATDDTTIENCQAACLAAGYIYSGAEFGYECFCDNSIQNAAMPENSFFCNQPCFGSFTETCGGFHAVSVYEEICSGASSSSATSTSTSSSSSSSTFSILPPTSQIGTPLPTSPSSKTSPILTVTLTSRVTLTSSTSNVLPKSPNLRLPSASSPSFPSSPSYSSTNSSSTQSRSSSTHSTPHTSTPLTASSKKPTPPTSLQPSLPTLHTSKTHYSASLTLTSSIYITTTYTVTSCPPQHPCTSHITTETLTSYTKHCPETTAPPPESIVAQLVPSAQSPPTPAETPSSLPPPESPPEQIKEGASVLPSLLSTPPSLETISTSSLVGSATLPAVQSSFVTVIPLPAVTSALFASSTLPKAQSSVPAVAHPAAATSEASGGTTTGPPGLSSPTLIQASAASHFDYKSTCHLILGVVIALAGGLAVL